MKKTLHLLFLLFGAFSLKAETEPNDNSAAANTLAVNATDNGSTSVSDNFDWWKITTTVDGRLTLSTTNPTGGQFYIRLYDANATTELVNSFKDAGGGGG